MLCIVDMWIITYRSMWTWHVGTSFQTCKGRLRKGHFPLPPQLDPDWLPFTSFGTTTWFQSTVSCDFSRPQLRAVEVLDVLSEAAVRGGSQLGTFAVLIFQPRVWFFPWVSPWVSPWVFPWVSSRWRRGQTMVTFDSCFVMPSQRKATCLGFWCWLQVYTWKWMTFHKEDTHTHTLYYILYIHSYIHTLFVYIMWTQIPERNSSYFLYTSLIYIYIHIVPPQFVSGLNCPSWAFFSARFPAGFCLWLELGREIEDRSTCQIAQVRGSEAAGGTWLTNVRMMVYMIFRKWYRLRSICNWLMLWCHQAGKWIKSSI